MRCRVRCASNGFSMSATSAQTCFCGNNYPSVFHRVPDTQCGKPCSPDRTVCEGAGCCGDKAGKYYTVSFAKEIDVTLQLLRTLTYDYRSQNKRFQQYIESKIASTAALQVRGCFGVDDGRVIRVYTLDIDQQSPPVHQMHRWRPSTAWRPWRARPPTTRSRRRRWASGTAAPRAGPCSSAGATSA